MSNVYNSSNTHSDSALYGQETQCEFDTNSATHTVEVSLGGHLYICDDCYEHAQ